MKYIPKYQRAGKLLTLPHSFGMLDFDTFAFYENLKSKINPKNWRVPDYSDKGDFNTAYSTAKKAGEEEFMWNGKRYNTKYAGTPRQEVGAYGIDGKPVHRMDLNNPLQVNRYKTGHNTFLVGHIEVGYPLQHRLTGGINKNSSGFNVEDFISEKDVGEQLYVYGADDYNIESAEYNYDYNLLTNNCADAVCDAFGLNSKGITTPKDASNKIKDKYQTIDVMGRTYSDYFAKWRDAKKNILNDADYWIGISNSPDIVSTPLSKNIIRTIQNSLHKNGYDLPLTFKSGLADGIWGDETKQALLDYQTKNKVLVSKKQKGGVINSTPVFLGNIPFVSNKQSAINRSREILKEQEDLAKSISVRNPVYKSQQEADSELNSTAYNWVTGDRQTYNSFLPGVTIKASNTPVGYRGDMKSMREDLLNTSPLIHSQVPRKYDKYKIADRISNEAPAANPSNQGLINAAKFVATEFPLAVTPLPFVDNAIRGFKYLNGRLTNHIISKVENPKYLETVWNRINNTAKFKTDPIWYTLQTPHRLVNKELNKRIAHLESIPNFTENTVKKLKVLENIKDGLDKVYDVGINHSWINTHNPLGEGGYSIAYPSMRGNKVIKFGRVPDFETAETLQHMVNIGKANKNPRLALPYIIQKVGKENSTDIYGFVMNKVPGTKMEKGFMPKLENIKQLGKELGDLTDKGIYLDYANPDNVLYDEITGKLSALDFNTLPPEGSWFLRNNAIDQTPLESLEDRFFGIPKKSIWPSP